MEGMDDGAMETRFNNRFAEIQQSILLIEWLSFIPNEI